MEKFKANKWCVVILNGPDIYNLVQKTRAEARRKVKYLKSEGVKAKVYRLQPADP